MADVLMPQLGETVTTGTIVKWCKQVGDYVAEDDPLFEVSTDKIDTEIPSHLEGTLTAILVAEGETVSIGTVIATIGGADDVSTVAAITSAALDVVASSTSDQDVDVASVSVAPPELVSDTDDSSRHVITPVVSQLAAQHGVDLASIVGTGTGGRVTKADVLAATLATPSQSPQLASQTTLTSVTAARPAANAKSVEAIPVLAADGDQRVALSRARVRAADNLRASVDEAVHTLVVMEADYTNVWQLREDIKADFKVAEGFSLTFLPFVARAVCDALHNYPHINAALDMGSATEPVLVVRKHVNLGVAVDLGGDGLIVPVVQRAEEFRLRGLARAVNDLAQRARAKHLGPDDFVGGTFTLTNAGGYGTLHTAPIMQRGQVGIIGTDAVQHRAVAVEQAPGQWGLAAKPMGNLSFSFDHRAFDGAYASQFLREVADRIAQHDWRTEL